MQCSPNKHSNNLNTIKAEYSTGTVLGLHNIMHFRVKAGFHVNEFRRELFGNREFQLEKL
jgi:hypothetical protein